MQEFRVGEAGLKKLRKRMLTIVIPIIVVTFTVVIITNIPRTGSSDINVLPIILPIVGAWIFFTFWRSFKKPNKILLSFKVTISDLIDNPQAVEASLQTLAPISTKSMDPAYKKYALWLLYILQFKS